MTTTLLPRVAPPDSRAAHRAGPAVRPAAPPGRLARLARGHPGDPVWVRPALLVLLAATAVLYLWGLGASGNANSFYAAAVQAGTTSWKAFFFGSFDSANFITVDKPPAALWVMELSARVFGFSSWSMLAPQALEGVAAVGLLYAAVRRWSGPLAGLAAGAALAVTPAATLMFRFNNPDALLVLLLVAGAYCTVRAIETASTRWLVLAGVAVGFGFLTKMGQALLVVPAFALAHLVAAPTSLRRRLVQLVAAGGALVAAAGWWVAIVQLWPASTRPYIGGSTTNSVLDLVLGYNGLGRLLGGSGNGGGAPSGVPSAVAAAYQAASQATGGAGGNAGFGGNPGIGRLFGSEMATEVSWLLPAALLSLLAGLWTTRRAPRTDRTRAALVLWGGWLLVTGVVFSFMQGTIHPYYTVALAPAIPALVAIAGRELWRHRSRPARAVLVLLVAVTAAWGWVLLDRTPTWFPVLRYLLLAVAAVACAGLLLVGGSSGRRLRRVTAVVAVTAALTGLLGTTAYALETAATAHTGSIPTAGPASSSGPGGGTAGVPPSGTAAGGTSGASQLPGGGQTPGGETTSAQLVSLLQRTTTTWSAAAVGSQTAAPLQLASGTAVMSIGGFNGSDATPTLAQFQQYVAEGKVHYFVVGGTGGGSGGDASSTASSITTWVEAHFTAATVGGQTVYDLTSPSS